MELDVRPIPKARKHATIFETFTTLLVEESFVLVNDHDPLPLRALFEVNFARSFSWTYEEAGPELWRVRITKIASTPLPQILGSLNELATADTESDLTGAIWKIPVADRDLDSNVIVLPAEQEIEAHQGPELDVMLVIIAGAGTLRTETDELTLQPDSIVWLPRRSRRAISAGPDGLRYLTVHRHKTGLQISQA